MGTSPEAQTHASAPREIESRWEFWSPSRPATGAQQPQLSAEQQQSHPLGASAAPRTIGTELVVASQPRMPMIAKNCLMASVYPILIIRVEDVLGVRTTRIRGTRLPREEFRCVSGPVSVRSVSLARPGPPQGVDPRVEANRRGALGRLCTGSRCHRAHAEARLRVLCEIEVIDATSEQGARRARERNVRTVPSSLGVMREAVAGRSSSACSSRSRSRSPQVLRS